jgi:hypothetical protein
MTERELQDMIEEELRPITRADAVEFAADLAHLAATGLVEFARAGSGELRIELKD